MVNIAFLSTAHIHTKSFIKDISGGTDGRRVYAIWDDVADRGQRYAEQCGAKFVADINALLADDQVDAVAICAENARHLPLLEKALAVRKPVFCEKPIVTTVADARRVVALLKKQPTILMSGYFQPFSGTMQSVAQMLGQQDFGKVTRARFRNAHHAAYGHWFDNPDLQWFHDPSLAGGGALMDMGTHAVHLLRTLFGPVMEVWATVRNEAAVYPRVDDFGVAHLRFASGVLGTVEAAWTQTGGIGGLEVVGTTASLWNDGKNYVVGKPGCDPALVAPLAERPTRMDRLVAAVEGRLSAEELRSDLDAAMDTVAIMEAAYESSRIGTWVKVAPL